MLVSKVMEFSKSLFFSTKSLFHYPPFCICTRLYLDPPRNSKKTGTTTYTEIFRGNFTSTSDSTRNTNTVGKYYSDQSIVIIITP